MQTRTPGVLRCETAQAIHIWEVSVKDNSFGPECAVVEPTLCLLPIGTAPLPAASLASGLLATLMKTPEPFADLLESDKSAAGSVGMLILDAVLWTAELSLVRGERTVDDAGAVVPKSSRADPSAVQAERIGADEVPPWAEAAELSLFDPNENWRPLNLVRLVGLAGWEGDWSWSSGL